MMTNDYFERDKAAALNALLEAQKNPTRKNVEKAAALAEVFAKNWIRKPDPQPPTAPDLAAKRDARLYRETLASLPPEQGEEFLATHGYVPTIRRLASEARRLADETFEKREAEWQDAEYKKVMWQGTLFRNNLPPVDHDKIFELSAVTDQRRKERQEARKQRELAAEVNDEELARVLAGFDGEEFEIFNRLQGNLPTPLQAVEQFIQSKAPNPLEGIDDTGTLYRMGMGGGEEEPFPWQKDLPTDISKVDDSETLYNIALRDSLRDEEKKGG